jgi:hypothetical protein
MLIVWDKMFGTFQPEVEQPIYGLVHPNHSYDPLLVQFKHLRFVLRDAFSAKGLSIAIGKLAYGPG